MQINGFVKFMRDMDCSVAQQARKITDMYMKALALSQHL